MAKKALITILAEYSDFANIFFKKLVTVLPKHTKINIYTIDLKQGKQLPYRSIYILGSIKLEILKTYIKNNLANGFIYLSKFSVGALILFD